MGQLGALTEEQLGRLLVLRPDLADPVPVSLAQLEERCLDPQSAFESLLDADVLVLQLAQILTLIGENHAALSDVRELVGDVPEADLERGWRWLEDRHLVIRLPGELVCVHTGLLMIQNPAALGPPVAPLIDALSLTEIRFILTTLGDKVKGTRKADLVKQLLGVVTNADRVREVVEGAPASVRTDARRMALGREHIQLSGSGGFEAYRSRPGAATVPALWLLHRGLIYKDSWYTAVMPGEVGLALRGGLPFAVASYQRPQITAHPITPVSPSAAEGRATKVVEALERLVEAWGSKPAALLKDGGVGVREVRRLAGVLDLPERAAFRLVEMGAAAGLIVADPRQAVAMPTTVADEWSDLDAADRWWALALSWRETSMYPSLAGSTESGTSKPLAALGYGANYDSDAAEQRRGVLRAMRGLPAGQRADEDALVQLAVWDAPMRWHNVPGSALTMVRWTMEEMELLGVTVDGAPTPLASALLEGDRPAVRDLLAAPGAGTWHLILQTDLTALVSGRAPSVVRGELELLADIEGRGAATLYRFSEGSLGRAFDAGRTGEQILAFMGEHAAKGVPQPLQYLVNDVERRHGKVRLGPAGCYVRFEDPALAAQVVRDKHVAKLGLRLIAPTVLVGTPTSDVVLAVLRTAGYLATGESRDGATVHTAPTRHRAQVAQAPGHHAAQRSSTPKGAPARAVERWRRQFAPASSDESSVSPDTATLAATLLRTPGDPAATSTSGLRPTSGRGVELPTLLRRPANDLEGAEAFAAEIERLAAVLIGADGDVDEDGMTILRELLEMRDAADHGEDFDEDFGEDGDPERPTDILRERAEIVDVLELALQEEWLVRLSYVSTGGQPSEVSVVVLDVSATTLRGQVAPRWTDQKYVLDRVSWVRVLTPAEEDLLW